MSAAQPSGGPVDLDELPDRPIEPEVYERLDALVDSDGSMVGGFDERAVLPEGELPEAVTEFVFVVDGEWHFYQLCRGCGEWEHKAVSGGDEE